MQVAQLALQLYTVRDALESAPEWTLTGLSSMGYRNVELAGTAGLTLVRSGSCWTLTIWRSSARMWASTGSAMGSTRRWTTWRRSAVDTRSCRRCRRSGAVAATWGAGWARR